MSNTEAQFRIVKFGYYSYRVQEKKKFLFFKFWWEPKEITDRIRENCSTEQAEKRIKDIINERKDIAAYHARPPFQIQYYDNTGKLIKENL